MKRNIILLLVFLGTTLLSARERTTNQLIQAALQVMNNQMPERQKARKAKGKAITPEVLQRYDEVSIVGYADKGTGNPEINVMYAERRAAQCKDALVNKYGCDASRISIDSKGDTVQPFAENDKNRCVIIDSEAQYTVYE